MVGPTVDAARLQRVVEEALAAGRAAEGGRVASYIPELAKADPSRMAVAACALDGERVDAGEADHEVTIQSVCKPFLYALALDRFGDRAVHERVGVEPTGDPFDSLVRLEQSGRPHNPMINAGAIAVAGLLCSEAGAVGTMLRALGRFAGRRVFVDMPTYRSERASGDRNRAIAHLLDHFGMLATSVDEALDLYFQACSVLVSCRDLAVMAATLASGGVHPTTGERVLSSEHARDVLAVSSASGMYDAAGRFAFEVGMPAKSGVSGAIVAMAPGRLGVATLAPPLDPQGHSVGGMAALRIMAKRLSLHLFEAALGSRPVVERPEPVRVDAPSLERELAAALDHVREHDGGTVADYIPELSVADPDQLAVAACAVDGTEVVVGDADVSFPVQAAANPFAYALALRDRGFDVVHEHVGFEADGNPYNAIVLSDRGRPNNPLGNAGAIAVASLAPGDDDAERSARLLKAMSGFAGEPRLGVDAAVLSSERTAGARNRAIAHLLRNFGVVDDVQGALERYFEQCSLVVSCKLLARMAATLAAGGEQPLSGERVLPADLVRPVLSIMYTCGMHDASGRFAFEVGLPAKSGISGGILAIVPGRMGLAAFAPRVDAHAASVRGRRALSLLARSLRCGMFG